MKRHVILHTIETGGPGGAETVLLNLASGLDTQQFRSIVAVPEDRWLKRQLEHRGVETVLLPSALDPRGLMRLICEQKVNLIHSHLPDQNFYSSIAGLLARKNVIATYHGGERAGDAKQRLKMFAVRHLASFVVAVSDYLLGRLAELGFPPSKLVRVYNGIDVRRFATSSCGHLRRELGLKNGARIVGMVANQRASKSYECLVRAARRVIERWPDTCFVAVGESDPEIESRLKRLVSELGISDRFFMLGFRPDVPQILADLDVFALSSDSEGFSLATIEAMAAGRPVVVTRCGGPQEIVSDGLTGLLVPPGDPAALGDKIGELLGDFGRARELGRRARQEVEARFSVARMVAGYEQLYDQSLKD